MLILMILFGETDDEEALNVYFQKQTREVTLVLSLLCSRSGRSHASSPPPRGCFKPTLIPFPLFCGLVCSDQWAPRLVTCWQAKQLTWLKSSWYLGWFAKNNRGFSFDCFLSRHLGDAVHGVLLILKIWLSKSKLGRSESHWSWSVSFLWFTFLRIFLKSGAV